MGIFGISDEIIREEETNVGSRLQARTGVQKSMNWLMGVDQYGNKRSKTQRALVSGLKILAAAGVTAATGGAAAPLLAAAIGGATAAGISYGVGQNVKARARGTAGGGATVADVSRTQRRDYVNAALYTATAGTGAMYKQSLQKGVDAAARQAGEQSVQAIIPNQGRTALAQTAGQKSSSVGSNLMSQGMIDPNIATTQTIDTGSSIVSRAGEEAVKSAPKVTYMDALRQAPKDIAKFEQKMQGKLGEYGYKIAKKQAQRGVEKGIQKTQQAIQQPQKKEKPTKEIIVDNKTGIKQSKPKSYDFSTMNFTGYNEREQYELISLGKQGYDLKTSSNIVNYVNEEDEMTKKLLYKISSPEAKKFIDENIKNK